MLSSLKEQLQRELCAIKTNCVKSTSVYGLTNVVHDILENIHPSDALPPRQDSTIISTDKMTCLINLNTIEMIVNQMQEQTDPGVKLVLHKQFKSIMTTVRKHLK